MFNISIITPCSRPNNLGLIKNSINFPCNWYIVYDLENPINIFSEDWIHELHIKGGVSGNLQRNMALDTIPENQWVYVLDDDNLIHPNMYSALSEVYISNSAVKAIVFSQLMSPSSIRNVSPDTIKVCKIDQAQYIVSKELIRDLRYQQTYIADGYFIEELYNKHKNDFALIQKPICYYNKLKW
jgi:hypothetical protein